MTRFKTILTMTIVTIAALPTIAAAQMQPSYRYIESVANATSGTRAFDIPPAEKRAYGSGLDQMSRGLEARDNGQLTKACKHFRRAERHFRAAHSVREREWSAELVAETCAKPETQN